MTELEQLILQARFNGVPMNQIIRMVEGWTEGTEILGLSDNIVRQIHLQLAGIEPHQVAAFTDLLLSQVERAVIVDAAQEFNPDVLLSYFGPLDSVTRDTCTQVLTDPQNDIGYTVEEIGTLPVGLTDGGG